MRAWIGWIVLTLAIAAAVHVASIHCLPHLVMDRAMAQMGSVNTIHHGARATAEKHGVVRPSPDLLYSVCPYDLTKGPIFISAPVPAGTYWSVSLFDDATDNFFVRNDGQTNGGIALQVYYQTMVLTESSKIQLVRSPTPHGLVVFRTLVSDERNFAAIDAARRRASCTTLSSDTPRSAP